MLDVLLSIRNPVSLSELSFQDNGIELVVTVPVDNPPGAVGIERSVVAFTSFEYADCPAAFVARTR